MAYYPKTVCVTSYNSGGLGLDRQNFIKTLNIFSDILCIQKHFLLDAGGKKHSNTYKLNTLFCDTHDMLINPAFKECNEEEWEVLCGKGVSLNIFYRLK